MSTIVWETLKPNTRVLVRFSLQVRGPNPKYTCSYQILRYLSLKSLLVVVLGSFPHATQFVGYSNLIPFRLNITSLQLTVVLSNTTPTTNSFIIYSTISSYLNCH